MSLESKSDQDKIIDKLLEIEDRFPVNEWTVNDVKIWPFIRTSLAYSQRYRGAKKPTKSKKRINWGKLLSWFLSMPITLFRFSSLVKKSKRIFLGAKTHRRQVNGKWENIYFDKPINYHASKGEGSIMVDYGPNMQKDIVNSSTTFSIFEIYLWLKLKLRLKSETSYRIHLPEYEDFYEHALKEFNNPSAIKTAFFKKNIESQLSEFYERRRFWIGKLESSKVEYVYFLCYYSGLLYPLISACNHLNIKTVDVQHGGMGIGHWSYSSWSKVPNEGYELLPKYFWTWDQGSEQLINQWASKTSYHQAITQGTPWVDNYFDDSLVIDRKYILYNMTIDTLSPFLVDTFKHFIIKGYKIKFRLHPRLTNLRLQVEEELHYFGLNEGSVIEDSNILGLKQSLAECIAMISPSSGSIVEAINLGIKPILLPSIGSDYYKNQIDEEKLFFLAEQDDLMLIDLVNKSIELNEKVSISNQVSPSVMYLIDFEGRVS